MQAVVELRSTMYKPDGLIWNSFEQIVLDKGQRYKRAKLPKEFTMGVPRYCFHNSLAVALKNPDLVYVEGFAFSCGIMPVHHAWLARKGKTNVIEITNDNYTAYLGIPFTHEYLKYRYSIMKDSASLLDDWRNQFPCLYMNHDDLNKIIQK